jgi:hypothetical protein
MEQRAAYERSHERYERQKHVQQQSAVINLDIRIYPASRQAEIRATYRLVNTVPRPLIRCASSDARSHDQGAFDGPLLARSRTMCAWTSNLSI